MLQLNILIIIQEFNESQELDKRRKFHQQFPLEAHA
jgi:hypothetical protein